MSEDATRNLRMRYDIKCLDMICPDAYAALIHSGYFDYIDQEFYMKQFQEQLRGIDDAVSSAMGGLTVQIQPIPGEVPVLQLSIEGRDELPVFVTGSEAQILCMCFLWNDDEVKPEARGQLLDTMLELNPSIPLSSFGKVGDRFVMFGALSRYAAIADIAADVAAVSDNALDALGALSEYLN